MTAHSGGEGITITIKVFGGLREAFGRGEVQLDLASGDTLSTAFERLTDRYPDATSSMLDGIDAGYLNVLINGRNIHFLGGRTAQLSHRDSVAVLPPVGGG